MSAIVRRSRSHPNSLFDSSLSRDPFAMARHLLSWDPFQTTQAREASYVPRMNVVEKEDAFVVTADLPGVSDEDLEITVHDGRLTISGSRGGEERAEGETYYLYERQVGSFQRAFALPENADPEAIDASLDSGILTVRIGKRAEAQPRKIQINK